MVVLPAPLRPTKPTCSPGLTCSEAPRRTSCAPKDFSISERRNSILECCDWSQLFQESRSQTESSDKSPHFTQNGRGRQTLQAPRPLYLISSGALVRHQNGSATWDHFFAGDAAVAGEEVVFAAGDELGLAPAGAGVPAGFAASVAAGRKPRLDGLFNRFAATLFTIFASDMATITRA